MVLVTICTYIHIYYTLIQFNRKFNIFLIYFLILYFSCSIVFYNIFKHVNLYIIEFYTFISYLHFLIHFFYSLCIFYNNINNLFLSFCNKAWTKFKATDNHSDNCKTSSCNKRFSSGYFQMRYMLLYILFYFYTHCK